MFINTLIHSINLNFKFILFISCAALIGILLTLLSQRVSVIFFSDYEKISEYECGFEPFDDATRQPFNVEFYIIALVFLLFDIELILLLPWLASLNILEWESYWVGIFLILLLTNSYIFELKAGGLNFLNR